MVSRTRKNNKRRNSKRSRRVQRGGKLSDDFLNNSDYMAMFTRLPLDRQTDIRYDEKQEYTIENIMDEVSNLEFEMLEGEQQFKRLVSDTVEPYKDWVDEPCDVQLTKMREMGKESFEKLIRDLEKIRTYLINRLSASLRKEVTKHITRTIEELSIMKHRMGDNKKYWWQKKGFFDNHYNMNPSECKMLKKGLERLSLIPHKIAELYKTRADADADADEALNEIIERERLEQQDRRASAKETTSINARYNALAKKILEDKNTGGAKKSRKRRKTKRRKTTRRKPKRTNRRKLKSKKR